MGSGTVGVGMGQRSAAAPPAADRPRSPPPRRRHRSRSKSRAAGREVEAKVQQDVEIIKSPHFELARDGPEMVPRCSPGAGASHLSREGPVPPRSRAAGARGQLCRLTNRLSKMSAKKRHRWHAGTEPDRSYCSEPWQRAATRPRESWKPPH